MSTVKLHDKTFDIYISEEAIQQKVKELAGILNEEYKEKRPLFIAILNGTFMLAEVIYN